MNDDLRLALELADIADSISLPAFQAANHEVKTKPDRSPVTKTDVAVEAALRARLGQARPGDAVLGEEGGFVPGNAASGRRWIIDPIDGTKNFMTGVPLYGTLIALEVNGELAAAVVCMPALGCGGTRYWATKGGGAWKRVGSGPATQIYVNQATSPAHAVVALTGVETLPQAAQARFRRLTGTFFLDRKVGNTWAQMMVAEGIAAAAIGGHLSVWDLAAPRLIIEEAGGRMTTWSGGPITATGAAVSSNGVLHEELVRALRPGPLLRWHQRQRATHARVTPKFGRELG